MYTKLKPSKKILPVKLRMVILGSKTVVRSVKAPERIRTPER